MTVIQTLMGGGVSFSSGGPGIGLYSRLYLRVLNVYHSIRLFSAFSTVYDDTGLFGIHLTTAVDIAVKELTAIATPCQVTEVELNRAKNSTVSSVLHNLESKSKTTLTEDIGSQILANGFWKPEAKQALLRVHRRNDSGV